MVERCEEADSVNVGPGQRYEVIWKTLRPGKWLVHCHIPHLTTDNNVEQDEGGGLMMSWRWKPESKEQHEVGGSCARRLTFTRCQA